MKLIDEPIEGLKLLELPRFDDVRGSFVKTFHQGLFQQLGIEFTPREDFHSVSRAGVLRGLHFQAPPADHAKLVSCPHGRVLDVVLDLRKSAPSYGRFFSCELSATNHRALFMPSGFAHGFLALDDQSLVTYSVTSVHSPAHDSGIRWDSFGFRWPIATPILSTRDAAFVGFGEFSSPFEACPPS